MTPLLILGAQGQVGRALVARVRQAGIPNIALGHAECDIADQLAVERVLQGGGIVVNCAAYTSVDRAETEVEAAYRVNTVGVENLARVCARAGVPLIHLSTDHVFDGTSDRPAREEDPPRALNVYGRSKLGGEIAVRARLESHIILRTSWVFSADGQNFVKTAIRMASERAQLRIVDDQVGGPTAADDLASAILEVVATSAKPGFIGWGTYHFSGAPAVSRYEFARAIVADTGAAVVPVATTDYPTPARRPANSALDCTRILRVFGIKQPDWRVSLNNVRDALARIGGGQVIGRSRA
jgi:dTDP-4-dehydrorhamnose reductase